MPDLLSYGEELIPNVPLLRKVRDHIEEFPEEWAQTDWRVERRSGCGAAHCFGGWAVTLVGCEWDKTTNRVSYGGEQRGVPQVARAILGLTLGEAELLFDWRNTMSDIDAVLAEIYARAEARIAAEIEWVRGIK